MKAKEAEGYLAGPTRLSGRLDDWLAGPGRPHHSDGMAPLELFPVPKGDLGHARQDPINPAPDSVPTSSLSRYPGRGGERVCIALHCIYLNDRRGRLESWAGGCETLPRVPRKRAQKAMTMNTIQYTATHRNEVQCPCNACVL